VEIFRGDNFKRMREPPLFDQQHRVSGGVERYGAVRAGAAANDDLHGK
jgi:hypothetical protein